MIDMQKVPFGKVGNKNIYTHLKKKKYVYTFNQIQNIHFCIKKYTNFTLT